MLSVTILSAMMLSVTMLSVIMFSITMPSVNVLIVTMLIVKMLNMQNVLILCHSADKFQSLSEHHYWGTFIDLLSNASLGQKCLAAAKTVTYSSKVKYFIA
jgi:hypothetical protein